MKTSIAARNAMMRALVAKADNGFLRIYSGAMPAAPESAVVGELLAELRFAAPAFGEPVNGTATAKSIAPAERAAATGAASFFRVLASDGKTVLWDGSVGVGASADLNFNSTAIQEGARISVDALSYTLPA